VFGGGKVDENLLEELEEQMLLADMNVHTVNEIIDDLRKAAKEDKLRTPEELSERLKSSLFGMLTSDEAAHLNVASEKPTVYLFVGVNGVGKTTTIAKLAERYRSRGKKVIMAAADTFRAAAVDQLEIWASRTGAELIRHREGADPSAVVFDAINAARARGVDYVLADTAGRQHTSHNLMEELKKVSRVAEKALGRPADETLLVLDAVTGQNAIRQAQEFLKAVKVTGIVLTKLDGTSRGGSVVAIKQTLKIPIKLIGIGEKSEDLQDFHPKEFVDALL
jgi:fused signal recognition particle receptor